MVIDDEKAEVVKRIFELSIQGKGTRTIAMILNNEGVPTKYNTYQGTLKTKNKYSGVVTITNKKNIKWAPNTIYSIIKNTVYKGRRKWNDEFYDAPVIIPSSKWDKVNLNLRQNTNNRGKKTEYKYLLKGLVTCGKCGRNYYGRSRKTKKDHYYMCSSKRIKNENCGNRSINITKIESFILKHLFKTKELKEYLNDLRSMNHTVSALELRLKELLENKKLLEKKIKQLYRLLLDVDLEKDVTIKNDYLSSKDKLKKNDLDINEIEIKISEASSRNKIKDINKVFDNFTLEANFKTIKEAVFKLIERIEILHNYSGNKGYYLVKIKYKGFEESSTFLTDWELNNWRWINKSRLQATNTTELKEDIETIKGLYEYYGIEAEIPENFEGLEISQSMSEVISLDKNDLIDFD